MFARFRGPVERIELAIFGLQNPSSVTTCVSKFLAVPEHAVEDAGGQVGLGHRGQNRACELENNLLRGSYGRSNGKLRYRLHDDGLDRLSGKSKAPSSVSDGQTKRAILNAVPDNFRECSGE